MVDAAAIAEDLDDLVDARVDDLAERYELGRVIGEGRFSQVHAGKRAGRTPTLVALKVIELEVLLEDEEALEMLEAEVVALRRASGLGVSHVVRLHELVRTPSSVYLVMDRVPGRELFELVDERGALEPQLVRNLMRQLLSALNALAGVGVVHRDVKPENMMVSEAGEAGAEEPQLTLIDFGYAAILRADGSGGAGVLTGVAGSPEYVAPEVLTWLEAEADETGSVLGEPYDALCDVWSVGVTAHVLLCGELPFELPDMEECDESALVEAARSMVLDFSKPVWKAPGMEAAAGFVKACLVSKKSQRPSARALLDCEWLGASAGAEGAASPAAATEAQNGALQERPDYISMLDEAVVAAVAKASAAATTA